MPLLKLNRDYVMCTPSGLSFGFTKGVPLNVPTKWVGNAMMIGAEPCDDEAVFESAEVKAARDAEAAQAAKRASDIEQAVRLLVERNMAGDFTAGGKPNMKAVESLVGYDCTRDEVDHIFIKVRADMNGEG